MADFLLALGEFHQVARRISATPASSRIFLHRGAPRLSKGASHFRRRRRAGPALPRRWRSSRDGRLCITSVVELAKVINAREPAEDPADASSTRRRGKRRRCPPRIRPQEAAPHRLVVTAAKPAPPRPAPREQRSRCPAAPRLVSSLSRPTTSAALPVRPDEPPRAELPMAAPTQQCIEGRASHGRPGPASRHRLEEVHGEARRRPRRALPLPPGRGRRGHSGGGARPSHRASGEAKGALLETEGREAVPCAGSVPAGGGGREAFHAAIPAAVSGRNWIGTGPAPVGGSNTARFLCGSTDRLQFDHVQPCRARRQAQAARATPASWPATTCWRRGGYLEQASRAQHAPVPGRPDRSSLQPGRAMEARSR